MTIISLESKYSKLLFCKIIIMKILQKVFSIVTLLVFILSINPWSTYAAINLWDVNYYENSEENLLVKSVINNKLTLNKIAWWDKYITKVDKIIKQIKEKKDILTKLDKKITEIQDKLKTSKQTAKVKKFNAILWYMAAKVDLELYKLNIILKEENKQLAEKKAEEQIKAMKESKLSDSEMKKVENEIVKIQLNLFENFEDGLKSLTDEFNNLTNYEESWNLKMNFNFDHDLVWKMKSELELNNYVSKVSNFDSQFSWELKALLEASIKWEKEVKLKLDSLIDFISKDWNMYLLLEKLNITDEEGLDEIKDQIQLLKDIAEKNKYIKFEDKNTQAALEAIKNLNPSNILKESKTTLSEPMFKAYDKVWDKYLLVPTKYACEKFKELNYKLNPWMSSECSDSQYESMLEGLAESWELYIELWNKNKLWFNMNAIQELKKFESYIIFTDKYIEEINSVLETEDKDWKTQWFNLDYIKKEKLNFSLNVTDYSTIEFKSELDKSNNFEFIDWSLSKKWWNDLLTAKISLQDKELIWDFRFEETQRNYNYEKRSYEEEWKDVIKWKIEWKQNYKNELRDLNISIEWTTADEDEEFEINFSKKSDNYNFDVVYLEDNEEMFNANLELKNKVIKGNAQVYIDWKEFVKITSNWKYEKDLFELNTKIELAASISAISMQWYSQDAENSKVHSDIANITKKISIQTIIDYTLEDLVSDNNKINFKNLGENENDFKNPDWSDYLLFIKDNKFVVYWTIKNNWNIKAVIRWNYYKKNDTDPNSIVIINWKTINNWDIVWTYKDEIDDLPNAEININIEYDTESNNNDASVYIDYNEWDKKIFELNIENKWSIRYKDVEINKPSEEKTMDLMEAMKKEYEDGQVYIELAE